jgi:hypothetical protein
MTSFQESASQLRRTAYTASTRTTRDELYKMFVEATSGGKEDAQPDTPKAVAEVSRADFDALCTIVTNESNVNKLSRNRTRRLSCVVLVTIILVFFNVLATTASTSLLVAENIDTRVSESHDLVTKDGLSIVSTASATKEVPLQWAAFLSPSALEQVKGVTLRVPVDWDSEASDTYVAHYSIDGFELQQPIMANSTTGAQYRAAVLTLFTSRWDLIVIRNDAVELLRPHTSGRTSVCGRATCSSIRVDDLNVELLRKHVQQFMEAVPEEERCKQSNRRLDTQPYFVMCNPELAGVQGELGGDPKSTSCTQDSMVGGCTTCHLNAPSCKGNWESPGNNCACCY